MKLRQHPTQALASVGSSTPWQPRYKGGMLQRFFRGLRRLLGSTDEETDQSPHPLVVKQMLPRSCFTKTGPGVRRSTARALAKMTYEQREVARRMGWVR